MSLTEKQLIAHDDDICKTDDGLVFNPYNPLSYLTLILTILVMGISGFVGAMIEILKGNSY